MGSYLLEGQKTLENRLDKILASFFLDQKITFKKQLTLRQGHRELHMTFNGFCLSAIYDHVI